MIVMKSSMWVLATACTAALVLTACAAPAAPPPRQPRIVAGGMAPLGGTNWALATLGGQAPAAGTVPTLNFGPAGSAGGQDGCNTYTTSFTLEGSNLTFGQVAGTQIACEPPIMDQATAFQQMLQDTRSFALTDGNLALAGADGKPLATFTAQSTDLAGTKWMVTGVNNGQQAVVSVITGSELTVEFGPDGQVSGSAGCNTFSGPYIIDSITIAIGPLASTRKTCPTPEGVMDQEAQLLAALDSAASFNLDGNRLTLINADDATAVTATRAP